MGDRRDFFTYGCSPCDVLLFLSIIFLSIIPVGYLSNDAFPCVKGKQLPDSDIGLTVLLSEGIINDSDIDNYS